MNGFQLYREYLAKQAFLLSQDFVKHLYPALDEAIKRLIIRNANRIIVSLETCK
jgi:hypothetical protein